MKTASDAFWKLSGKFSKLSFTPAKIKKQAWPLRTCSKDPSQAPETACRASNMKSKLF